MRSLAVRRMDIPCDVSNDWGHKHHATSPLRVQLCSYTSKSVSKTSPRMIQGREVTFLVREQIILFQPRLQNRNLIMAVCHKRGNGIKRVALSRCLELDVLLMIFVLKGVASGKRKVSLLPQENLQLSSVEITKGTQALAVTASCFSRAFSFYNRPIIVSKSRLITQHFT